MILLNEKSMKKIFDQNADHITKYVSLYVIYICLFTLCILLMPYAMEYRWTYGGISVLLTSPISLWIVSIIGLFLWLKWRTFILMPILFAIFSFGTFCHNNDDSCRLTSHIHDEDVLSYFILIVWILLSVSYYIGKNHWTSYNWLKWVLSIFMFWIIFYTTLIIGFHMNF